MRGKNTATTEESTPEQMDLPCKKRRRTDTWDIPASQTAVNTLNPIRMIVDGMKLKPNPYKEMIALSIGDPAVFGNLPPATEAIEAVISVAKFGKNHGYTQSVGIEKARAAVAKYSSTPTSPLTSNDVVLCSGCSGALDIAITVLANPGQNILIPRPGFSLYKTLAHSTGIHTRLYDLKPDKCWEIDLEHLESLIDEDTACIVVCNPSNPCGSVFSKEHIEAILQVADRNKVPIIADEIYAHFVFQGEDFYPMASLTTEVPILSCGGLTKRWLVPGWRMGWICIHDRHGAFEQEIREGIKSLTQRILGPNTIIQGAVEEILTKTPQEFYDHSIHVVQKNATDVFECLSKVPGLKPIMPKGAMYMMVGIDMAYFPAFRDDLHFTECMVTEQSVFCLPGKCFEYPNYFRIVLTVPEEKVVIACERIREFCKEHYCCKASDSNGTNDLSSEAIGIKH